MVDCEGASVRLGLFATRVGGEALLLALAYQLEAELEWGRQTPPIWVGE